MSKVKDENTTEKINESKESKESKLNSKLVCPNCKKPIDAYVVANGIMYCSDLCVMEHLKVDNPR